MISVVEVGVKVESGTADADDEDEGTALTVGVAAEEVGWVADVEGWGGLLGVVVNIHSGPAQVTRLGGPRTQGPRGCRQPEGHLMHNQLL